MSQEFYQTLTEKVLKLCVCQNHFLSIPYFDEGVKSNIAFTVFYTSFTISSRSSHRICSVRKVVLRNFAKFIGKHLFQSLFFNKIAGIRPATLLKKRLWHRCFPVNFAKSKEHLFYRTSLSDCFCSSSQRLRQKQLQKQ